MISYYEIVIRLLLGAVIGGLIGFEREIHGRAAGFRTQLIVCVAAVLIMIISENYYHYMQGLDQSLRIDPARIASSALVGIGFLGAGVIIKSGFSIRGLTTAASIWIVSAIGLAIGAGLYFEGAVTAVITIIALMTLRMIERKIKVLRYNRITVSTPVSTEHGEEMIASLIMNLGFHIHSIDYEKSSEKGEIIYKLNVSSRDKTAIRRIFNELISLDYINTVRVSD
jgi:putative Mg2+ transporter-C (MgtC) family protein